MCITVFTAGSKACRAGSCSPAEFSGMSDKAGAGSSHHLFGITGHHGSKQRLGFDCGQI